LRAAREARQLLEGLSDPAGVDQASRQFIQKAETFLSESCQTGRKLRESPLPPKKAGTLKESLLRRLKRICGWELLWEPAEQLRCRLEKQGNNLLTFIEHPEVGPTNNQAEQSLRRSVIMRKITFGNRSPEGAGRQAMLSSLIQTAQRQGRDARAALESLWTRPTVVAQAAFYRQAALGKKGGRKKKNASARRPKGKDPPKTS